VGHGHFGAKLHRSRNGGETWEEIAVIRGGKGYGSWGPYSKCGTALEVLTASGQSCGCIAVPGLTPPGVGSSASIGRDGSLIVPRRSDGPCTYDLYPRLLR